MKNIHDRFVALEMKMNFYLKNLYKRLTIFFMKNVHDGFVALEMKMNFYIINHYKLFQYKESP